MISKHAFLANLLLASAARVLAQFYGGVQWTESQLTIITTVTGTFTVPNIVYSGDPGAAVYISVSIDGIAAPCLAGLQVGVQLSFDSNHNTIATAMEMLDYGPSTNLGIFPVSPGDNINATITASNHTTGTATLTNTHTGVVVAANIGSADYLCMQSATLGVEQVTDTLADFETVKFTDVSANTENGVPLYPSSATILNIKQNGETLTRVSTSVDSVTIKYK